MRVSFVKILYPGTLGSASLYVKGNEITLQAWTGPEGSRRLRLPDFKTIGLSALSTGRLYPQEIFLVLNFC